MSTRTATTAHTPGPWRLAKEPPDPIGLSVRLFGQTADKFLGVIHTGNDQYIANARLIAAAPDLLTALKELRAAFTYSEPMSDEDWTAFVDATIGRTDAAIAKATGSQSGTAGNASAMKELPGSPDGAWAAKGSG